MLLDVGSRGVDWWGLRCRYSGVQEKRPLYEFVIFNGGFSVKRQRCLVAALALLLGLAPFAAAQQADTPLIVRTDSDATGLWPLAST